MIRGWYLDELPRRYPELMKSVEPELRAFRASVNLWEHTSTSDWNAMPHERDVFYERLNDLIVALVAKQIERGRPAYATREAFASRETGLQQSVAKLRTSFALVPQGVVGQYTAKNAVPQLKPLNLRTRGINDGTLVYTSDDPIATDLIPAYRDAYLMRARYFGIAKNFDASLALFDKAIAIDPDDRMIERERNVMASYAAGKQ